jgi:hypothetical protein
MLIVLTNQIQNKRWEEQWAYFVWLIDSRTQWQNLAQLKFSSSHLFD